MTDKHLDRREFLYLFGAAGAAAALNGDDILKAFLNVTGNQRLPEDLAQESLLSVEHVFTAGVDTHIGEPAVAVAGGKLFAAAVVSKGSGNHTGLPLHIWVSDIDKPAEAKLKKVEIKGYRSGADPVIQYTPETDQMVIFSLVIRDFLGQPDTQLIQSVYDLRTNMWQEDRPFQTIEETPWGIDKPWFYWNNGKGWLIFVERISSDITNPVLYSCDKDLIFTKEVTLPIDVYSRGMPMAYPHDDGIHFIYQRIRRSNPFYGSVDIAETIYDPLSKKLSEEKILVEGIPNTIRKRQFEGWYLEKNLNGLVTPQGGIVITSATKDAVVLGYLPNGITEWKIIPIPVHRNRGEQAGRIGFVNPVVMGPDSFGLQFMASIRHGMYQSTKNTQGLYNFTILIGEHNGQLTTPQIAYPGEMPTRVAVENNEPGDYIMAVADTSENGGVPMVSLTEDSLKVRVFRPLSKITPPLPLARR